jgi:dolichyl-phosphate beta-glucosyltransferase
MPHPFLSVIIPSYNEQGNLARGVLDEVATFLAAQNYTYEVILTDDGSTDGTAAALDTWAAAHPHTRVLHNIHAGKGPTVQSGMLAATGEWQLFTDFDQSTPLSEVTRLLKFAKTEETIVIGSREGSGSSREKEPWYRHIMGRTFNTLVQILAVPGIQDTQCGFKLFSRQASHELFGNLTVYGRQKERSDAFTGAFDVEVLYLARRHGYQIKEVPIQWHHHETNRVNPLKDSVRMLIDILKIRAAAWRGAYDSA